MDGATPDQKRPGYDRYPGWEKWWLVARFKEAYPRDIPTPGHLQAMAAIVDGLGSPWNISTKWHRCRWYHTAKGAISFALRRDVATFDHGALTDLVLAAHKHCVRVELEPCNCQFLRVTFWPRSATTGSMFERHPTLEDLASRALQMSAKPQREALEA